MQRTVLDPTTNRRLDHTSQHRSVRLQDHGSAHTALQRVWRASTRYALIVSALSTMTACGQGMVADDSAKQDVITTRTVGGQDPRDLTYFGYYGSGWVANKPEGSPLEMNLSAYGDHVNIVDIRVDLATAIQKVRTYNQTSDHQIRVIVTVDPIFFGYDPKTICSWDTAVSAWQEVVPLLHANEDLIVAFSPMDEPYLDANIRNFSENQMTDRLNAISATIKRDFPDTPIYVNYGQGAPQRRIAAGVDWVSFTPAYGEGETGLDGINGEVYAAVKRRIAEINARYGRPKIKMVNIGHGYLGKGGWQTRENGYTKEQKTVFFAKNIFAAIERENNDGDLVYIVASIVFLWHDFDGQFGVQSAPLLQATYRAIGKDIIAKHPFQTTTLASSETTSTSAETGAASDTASSGTASSGTDANATTGAADSTDNATTDTSATDQATSAQQDTTWDDTAAAATTDTTASDPWVEAAPQQQPTVVAAYHDDGGYQPPSGFAYEVKKSFIDNGGWQWAAGGLVVGIAAVMAWSALTSSPSPTPVYY